MKNTRTINNEVLDFDQTVKATLGMLFENMVNFCEANGYREQLKEGENGLSHEQEYDFGLVEIERAIESLGGDYEKTVGEYLTVPL